MSDPVKPRGVERHMALFAAYGASIKALSPAAWQRLRTRCAPLEGDSFAMVVRRARFAAQARDVFEAFTKSGRARFIASANRATQTTIGVFTELALEFGERSRIVTPGPMAKHNDAKHELYARGWYDMEGALQVADPSVGVTTAIRAAGAAVVHHDWLTPATFADIYHYVELEVPYATVERDADHQ